jgi:hypothetical protein
MAGQGEEDVVEARLAHGQRDGNDSFAVECAQRVDERPCAFVGRQSDGRVFELGR